MVRFPNCKINLGLNITSKRADGYHNLETVFYPLQFKDALEIISSSEMEFEMSGLKVEGNKGENLCLKSYDLLKKDFPQLPAVKIHLHKAIPAGAGLAGGSSNAAFMLRMLNDKFHLELSEARLSTYAQQLGSDCPFFILNKPAFAGGRGELLEPVELNLSSYQIILINPNIHISTRDAFSHLTPTPPAKPIKNIIAQPVSTWKEELINDFEKSVFNLHSVIKAIKDEMYAKGAMYASMTGTGSTVYGIFDSEVHPKFSFPENYIQVFLR
jgi:4-diphosphocytidyl-2-C-methyl-D-erythritol kinase